MTRYKDLFESSEDITHEVLTHHGFQVTHSHKTNSWFHPSPRDLDVNQMCQDLVSSGWRTPYVDEGPRFSTMQFRAPGKTLHVNVERHHDGHVITSQAAISYHG